MPGFDTERKGLRGGVFDELEQKGTSAPGDPAHSAEGWVVFASNLHPTVTEDDLKDFFSVFGKIHNARLIVHHQTFECLGCAVVEYLEYDSALAAVNNGTGTPFVQNAPIQISFAFVVPDADDDTDPLEAVVHQNPQRKVRARPEGLDRALEEETRGASKMHRDETESMEAAAAATHQDD
jgi:hypothetical protein